jgi:hypothetical protein
VFPKKVDLKAYIFAAKKIAVGRENPPAVFPDRWNNFCRAG